MKKIAILTCLKSNDNCTRASCLKAFFDRNGYFSKYKNEELELTAVWTCQGCENNELDDYFEEKFQRILSTGTEIVHIGICCQTRTADERRCLEIIKIEKMLNDHGIKTIWGTHSY